MQVHCPLRLPSNILSSVEQPKRTGKIQLVGQGRGMQCCDAWSNIVQDTVQTCVLSRESHQLSSTKGLHATIQVSKGVNIGGHQVIAWHICMFTPSRVHKTMGLVHLDANMCADATNQTAVPLV